MLRVHFFHAYILVELDSAFLLLASLEEGLGSVEAVFRDLGLFHLVDAVVQEFNKVPARSLDLEEERHFVEAASDEGVFVHKDALEERVALVKDFVWLGFHFLSCLRYIDEVKLTIMSYNNMSLLLLTGVAENRGRRRESHGVDPSNCFENHE